MSASSMASSADAALVATGGPLGGSSSIISPTIATTTTNTIIATNDSLAAVRATSAAITQSDKDGPNDNDDDDSTLVTDTGLTKTMIIPASSPDKILPKISLTSAPLGASLNGNGGDDDRTWLTTPLIKVPSNNTVDIKLKSTSNIVQINKSPNSNLSSPSKIPTTTSPSSPPNNRVKITSSDLAPPPPPPSNASNAPKLVSSIKTAPKNHFKDPIIIKSSSSSHHNNHNNNGCLPKPLVINHSPNVVNITHNNQTLDQLQPLIPNLSSQLIFSSIITTQAKSLASVQVPPRARITPQQQVNLFSPSKPTTPVMSNRSPPASASSNSSPSPATTTSDDPTICSNRTLASKLGSPASGGASSSSTTATAAAATNAVSAKLLDMGKRLLDAARAGQTDQVRQLVVSSGAPFTSDWLGTTALHLAAQHGHAEIAEILLRGGVNRDARTKLERTALHLAAQGGWLEVVDLLLVHGSDVNVRDMLKMTPLHWAVERGHVAVVERLLFSGADASARSKFRLTPIDIAQNSHSYEMLDLFRNWINKTTGGTNLVSYVGLSSGSLNNLAGDESHELLDVIDFHHPAVAMNLEHSDTADNVLQGHDSVDDLDIDEPCIDLVELEWNSLKFEPDFFLSNDEDDDEPNVEYLMKIVEELQKENRQLRQRVEQLSSP